MVSNDSGIGGRNENKGDSRFSEPVLSHRDLLQIGMTGIRPAGKARPASGKEAAGWATVLSKRRWRVWVDGVISLHEEKYVDMAIRKVGKTARSSKWRRDRLSDLP